MTKQELVDSLVAESGGELTRKTAAAACAALATVAAKRVADGEAVLLPGIGKLRLVERAARVARNPRTGEAVAVAAKSVLKFAPAAALAQVARS